MDVGKSRGNYFLDDNDINREKLRKIGIVYPEASFNDKLVLANDFTSLDLRDYQKQDVKFLSAINSSAIFSEMRTGKTPVALKTFEKFPVNNLIVVVPNIIQKQ
jgi:superfamily II DNA or RNA helicase